LTAPLPFRQPPFSLWLLFSGPHDCAHLVRRLKAPDFRQFWMSASAVSSNPSRSAVSRSAQTKDLLLLAQDGCGLNITLCIRAFCWGLGPVTTMATARRSGRSARRRCTSTCSHWQPHWFSWPADVCCPLRAT